MAGRKSEYKGLKDESDISDSEFQPLYDENEELE